MEFLQHKRMGDARADGMGTDGYSFNDAWVYPPGLFVCTVSVVRRAMLVMFLIMSSLLEVFYLISVYSVFRNQASSSSPLY
jgi:hypothetical protein